MRRLTAWIGGVAGGIAAYRFLRRCTQVAAEPPPPESDERAEELRAKLAENRVVDEAEPEPEPESPEDRRRQVHEEGRAALDEMKSDEPGG